MRVPLGDLAQFGVNKDLEGYTLPPNAWTDARNVRLHDGKLVRFSGHIEALAGFAETPYYVQHVFDVNGGSHWIVADLDKVFEYSSGTYTDISKTATTYTTTIERLWNGGVLGNIPILNNGMEVPQMWAPVSSAQRLVNLTNWNTNNRAGVIRVFKEFVFALDLTETGVRFPHRVLISHPAAPGTVPSSWDPSDPTKDVYTKDVGDTDSGAFVDAEHMRDFMVLYKERSTHGAQFIGGRDKWRIFPIFTQIGLFQPHCMCSIKNNSLHLVMTGEDVIVHNAQTPESVFTERMRRWFLANIDQVNYPRSFVCHNQQEQEAWVCVPLSGSAFPNVAVVINYGKNTITFRDLPQISFINSGVIPVADDGIWDDDEQAWDEDTSTWESFTHPPFIRRLLAAQPGTQKLLHLDTGETFDGTSFEASIEHFGFDLIGVTKEGQPIRNREMMRLVKRVYFQAKGSPFFTQLGMQEEIDGPVTWSTPELFTPGTDKFVDFEDAKATQLFGLRLYSLAPGGWEIAGIEIDIAPLGEF